MFGREGRYEFWDKDPKKMEKIEAQWREYYAAMMRDPATLPKPGSTDPLQRKQWAHWLKVQRFIAACNQKASGS